MGNLYQRAGTGDERLTRSAREVNNENLACIVA